MPRILPAFIASAALAISAQLAWPGLWLPYALLKTLTTLLVIGHALRLGGQGTPMRMALLAGLVLSLVGDVALLWPQQGFLPGLVAFLLAHLAYLVAFTRGVPGARLGDWPLAFAGYAVLAAAVLALQWPGVPAPLRAPVAAYVVCLAAMAAQTASAWHIVRPQAAPSTRRRLAGAAIGGALFLTSDALLAINRFHTPLPLSTLWILATYWAAQWLIASTLAPRR